MYLTHDEYTQMGGDMDAALFIRLEAKARKRMDAVTFGRLMNEDPVRESVRMCIFELVGAMHEEEVVAGLSGREISSVTNDGVSVTYATGNSQTGARNGAAARYTGIIRTWLSGETDACGVNLIYAGVGVK